MGKLSKNYFTSASVQDLCMLLHGITGPRTKVHEIRGISFDWPDVVATKSERYPL